ncbi:SDR family oxidoreductase [Rhodococcus sp. NPDC003318]|uniref:SDR family oxidoreductase n=1 Tax=Rhodococcus sp. NPDC003318 TaxID=3364503 RepID=UPI003691E9D0
MGVVTGVGYGLGAACARQLVDHVETLLLTDRDPHAAAALARELVDDAGVDAEPFSLDVTDRKGLARLVARIADLGTLRAVAHADVCAPTSADWQQILAVDLVTTARLADALRPLADNGTAMVVLAGMSPMLGPDTSDAAAPAVLDDPLAQRFLRRLREALGPAIEDPAAAHAWAKRGLERFVRRESVRLGSVGARICSVSTGNIGNSPVRSETAEHSRIGRIVQRRGHDAEIAAVVAFALSEQASLLNGIDLLVDGGASAALDFGTVRAAATPVQANRATAADTTYAARQVSAFSA